MDRSRHLMSWNQSQSGDQTHSRSDRTNQTSVIGEAPQVCSRPGSHYSFFVPIHYTPSYRYPLLIWLHNDGFNENQVDRVIPHISVRNYLGVGVRASKAADAAGHRYSWHDSPAAITASHDAICEAIDEAVERFSINVSRVILAGYLQGGTMAIRIAMRQPQRFAGVVSIGGRMPQRAMQNLTELRRSQLPMLWQWASGHDQYTTEGLKSDCQAAMMIGSRVEVRQYPGDDELDTVVFRDIDDWIMRTVLPQDSAIRDRWVTSPTTYSPN